MHLLAVSDEDMIIDDNWNCGFHSTVMRMLAAHFFSRKFHLLHFIRFSHLLHSSQKLFFYWSKWTTKKYNTQLHVYSKVMLYIKVYVERRMLTQLMCFYHLFLIFTFSLRKNPHKCHSHMRTEQAISINYNKFVAFRVVVYVCNINFASLHICVNSCSTQIFVCMELIRITNYQMIIWRIDFNEIHFYRVWMRAIRTHTHIAFVHVCWRALH